jgi:hypothetical protein
MVDEVVLAVSLTETVESEQHTPKTPNEKIADELITDSLIVIIFFLLFSSKMVYKK